VKPLVDYMDHSSLSKDIYSAAQFSVWCLYTTGRLNKTVVRDLCLFCGPAVFPFFVFDAPPVIASRAVCICDVG